MKKFFLKLLKRLTESLEEERPNQEQDIITQSEKVINEPALEVGQVLRKALFWVKFHFYV